MGVFTKYEIVGNDLVLIENLHWEFVPHRNDSITEWRLYNVNQHSLDKQKLESLISYGDDSDAIEENLDGKKNLKIFPHLEDNEFYFSCDDISKNTRPFNIAELTEIIMRQEQTNAEQNATISKQYSTLCEIARFLENEIDKKSRILAQTTDKTSRAFIKSQDQLDTLLQLKNIVNSKK